MLKCDLAICLCLTIIVYFFDYGEFLLVLIAVQKLIHLVSRVRFFLLFEHFAANSGNLASFESEVGQLIHSFPFRLFGTLIHQDFGDEEKEEHECHDETKDLLSI